MERAGVAPDWRKGAVLFAGREKDAAAATKGIEMLERRGVPARRKALANSLATGVGVDMGEFKGLFSFGGDVVLLYSVQHE